MSGEPEPQVTQRPGQGGHKSFADMDSDVPF